MDYPSQSNPWSGYLVVQCKYRQRSTGDSASDTEWVTRELSSELSKYPTPQSTHTATANKPQRRLPTYYIFATNAVLTGNATSGGHDRCTSILNEQAARLGMQGCAIWGFDELRAYLDSAHEIRQTYLGFILPDDVLHQAIENLAIQQPDFEKILSGFLQKELQSDYAAKLESAGQHDEKRIVPLSKVFIDLPFTSAKEKSLTPSDSYGTLARQIINVANSVIRYSDGTKNRNSHFGRYAIVGGPGQGKSTIGQYLCQLYRAAILENCGVCDPESIKILEGINTFSEDNSGFTPSCLRFPFRIILNRFASDLSKDSSLTIYEYVRQRIEKLGNSGTVNLSSLKRWMAGYPWIFVLDGLDEVPSSSNRTQVLEAIQHFLVDLSIEKADVIVIATTRPQGYSDEFAKSNFQHVYLPPLSAAQALKYGSSLLEFRSHGDADKFDTTCRRLQMAAKSEATVRLMSSPLQVTIMATLVERLGEPPKQRYRLFEEYYRTIYTRESNREGSHSELLRTRKTDIDIIHYRTGLLLQAQSEIAGGTGALLPLNKFVKLVQQRLEEHGLDGSESNRLIEEIKSSALDRLIFLVSPQNEEVGFEIRSLQEFMAAEAITKGNTTLVRSRIREIAPITSWRNVFLFLVGKLFSDDNIELLDGVILLCDELNDSELHPEYSYLKWGSRLALEILSDGITRPSPIRERKLLRTALESLENGHFDDAQELSSVYHDKLSDIYREKLDITLQEFRLQKSFSSWTLLNSLALKGVSWAQEKYDFLWSKLEDTEKAQLIPDEGALSNSWQFGKVLEMIPQLEPWRVSSLIKDAQQHEGDEIEKNWPSWLVGLRDLFDNAFPDGDEELDTPIPIEISCGNHSCQGFIEHHLISSWVIPPTASAIFEMPKAGPHWAGFFSIVRFKMAPSGDTLASALRTLGQVEMLGWSGSWLRELSPWPLRALLDGLSTTPEIAMMAQLAESGYFGDLDLWLQAESVAQQSPEIFDLNQAPVQYAYDRNSLAKGLPLAGSYFIQTLNADEIPNMDLWAAILINLADSVNAAWAMRSFNSQIGLVVDVASKKGLAMITFSSSLALAYFTVAQKRFPSISSELVRPLLRGGADATIDPSLLDALCSGPGTSFRSNTATLLRTEIREAVLKARISAQALKWATWCAWHGIPLGLSNTELALSDAADKLTPFERALVRLGSDDMTSEECECLIKEFEGHKYGEGTETFVQILALSVERLPYDKRKALRKLALETLSKGALGEPVMPLADLYSYCVYATLDERRSTLSSEGTWSALQFAAVPTD